MNTAMTATNQLFSWKRVTALLRQEFAVEGRKMGLLLLAIYLLFTFILCSVNWTSRGMKTLSVDPMMVFLFIAIIASMGFSGLLSKGKRTAYLPLPASNVEKFTVNAMVYVIGGIVAVLACICLADLTRMALFSFKQGDDFLVPGLTALSDTAVKWVDPNSYTSACLPKFLLNCLWYASVFMLGSILWPKHSIVKTAIVMALYWIITIFGNLFFIPYDLMTQDTTGLPEVQMEEAIKNAMRIEDTIVIILCWLGGWFLFKKKDVISRKWWK